MTIPKKIFYCWFGGEKPKKVLSCIENWKDKLYDFEVIEINEHNKDIFDFDYEIKNNKWFRTCYEKKMWAYCSDYARLKVLYKYGGVYFDTDVTVLKSFDDLLYKNKLILGWENEFGINGAVIVSNKENTILKKILDFYDKDIWDSELHTIPTIILEILNKNYTISNFDNITENDEVLIYTPEFFYPMPFGQKQPEKFITNNSYTIHWWDASWVDSEIVAFLKYKHIKDKSQREKMIECYQRTTSKNSFFETIFSIKNCIDKKTKKITILGLKFYIKRNKKGI